MASVYAKKRGSAALTLLTLLALFSFGCQPADAPRASAAPEVIAPAPAPAPLVAAPEVAVSAPLLWRSDGLAALREAREQKRPVMIDFWAEWCEPCLKMDRDTFSNARVREALEGFVAVRVDVTRPSADTQALTDAYKVMGYPTLLLISAEGLVSSRHRFERFVRADELIQALRALR